MVAAAGAASVSAPQGGGGGQNPFQIATNLYAEKNLNGLINSQLLTLTPAAGGGQINAGQYLRGLRLIVRTVVNGATIPISSNTDAPFGGSIGNPGTGGVSGVFSQLDMVNVDGSEILYNMQGIAHYFAQKYGKPWLVDPANAYDFVLSATQVAFTQFLQPEIRFTAGVLANTDTRSQYRWDQSIVGFTGAGTQPTISVTPYMDAWAQPDDKDLQGTPNQPVPPGVNLQVKRRHQIFNTNGNASDNIFLSALTGNAKRLSLLIWRDSAGVRAAGASDPIYWQVDNRSLGRLNPDIVTQWANDFYGSTYAKMSNPGAAANATLPGIGGVNPGTYGPGVYAFPRFMEPGSLTGQGWLYTSNATKEQWETVTATGGVGTVEEVAEEVYPVGPVDPSLVDI